MNKSKWRVIACILTVFMMVFTAVPYMGAGYANADTNQNIIKNTPTPECAIEQVEFIDTGNGDYSLNLKIDIQKFHLQDVQYAGSYCLIVKSKTQNNKYLKNSAGPFDYSTDLDHAGYLYFENVTGNTKIQPDETIAILFQLCMDSQGDSPYDYAWKNFECTAPQITQPDPEPTPTPDPTPSVTIDKFEKIEAKAVLDEYLNELYVEYEMDNYSGKSYAKTVVFRQDMTDFSLVCVEDYGAYDWGTDYSVKPGRTYKYFATKNEVLDKYLSDLAYKKGETVNANSAQISKLSEICVTSQVEIPVPQVAEVYGLTTVSGVKKAGLKWKCDDLEHVTGYSIALYDSKDNLAYQYDHRDRVPSYDPITCNIKYKGTYTFAVMPYYIYEGEVFYGKTEYVSVTSAKVKAPTAAITKISKTNAKITIYKAEGATGTEIYQKVGKKWKKIKTTTAKKVTWKKNKAGTTQYKFKSYIKEDGATYRSGFSKIYKPVANIRTLYSSNNVSSYEDMSQHWRPTKLYYSNGKVMVKGKFINTHIYYLDYIKVRVTIKVDGKKVGTKVIKSGRVSGETVKAHKAVSFGKKAGLDLRNGVITYSYDVIAWK